MEDLQDGQVQIYFQDCSGKSYGKMIEAGVDDEESINESVAGALFGIAREGFLVAELPTGVTIMCPINSMTKDEDGASDSLEDWSALVQSYIESWMPRLNSEQLKARLTREG